MKLTKLCHHCSRRFEKRVTCSVKDWQTTKYCSRKCCDDAKRGLKMSGERLAIQRASQLKMIKSETSQKRAERMKNIIEARTKNGVWKHGRLGKKAELDPCWLGENASYNAKHRWIQINWEKTGVCERCGKTTKPFGKRHFGTEWSNNSGEYRRTREDWEELCIPCHRRKDRIPKN